MKNALSREDDAPRPRNALNPEGSRARAQASAPSFGAGLNGLWDMGAGALRGATKAALGAPGDISSALNALIYGDGATFLPTSENVGAWLPPINGHTAGTFERVGEFIPISGGGQVVRGARNALQEFATNAATPARLGKQRGAVLAGSVDDGVIKKMYHGTAGDHTKLDDSFSGTISSGDGRGHWFAYDPGYAWEYAENAGGIRGLEPRLATANVRVKTPLTVKFNSGGRPTINGNVVDFESNRDVINFAKKNGYDSVDFPDGSFTDDPSMVVFDGSSVTLLD